MKNYTDSDQYTFDTVPIDLIDLYEQKKEMLWKQTPEKASTNADAINYLMLKHHIDYNIIQEFIEKGMLWQGKYRKTIEFPIVTERNDIVAIEAVNYNNQGCYRTSQVYGYGFSYLAGDAVNWIVFVKSAIELMSLYQLRKSALVQAGCLLVSTCGVSPTVIARYKSLYPHAQWCIAFYPNRTEKHTLDKYFNNIRWKLPDTAYKKWNEELIAESEKRYTGK